MPFEVSEKFIGSANTNKIDTISPLCFSDIYDKSCKNIQASAREVALTAGTTSGAVEEFKRESAGTVSRAGATFVVGAALGALAVAESPVIAAAAVATGAVLTGAWALETLNPFEPRNQTRFSKIAQKKYIPSTYMDSRYGLFR